MLEKELQSIQKEWDDLRYAMPEEADPENPFYQALNKKWEEDHHEGKFIAAFDNQRITFWPPAKKDNLEKQKKILVELQEELEILLSVTESNFSYSSIHQQGTLLRTKVKEVLEKMNSSTSSTPVSEYKIPGKKA